jgi:hypothetical protein
VAAGGSTLGFDFGRLPFTRWAWGSGMGWGSKGAWAHDAEPMEPNPKPIAAIQALRLRRTGKTITGTIFSI